MEFEFRQNAGQQDYTPSGAAVVSGQVVQLADGRAAVVKTSLADGVKGAVYTKEIGDCIANTAAWSDGDPIYWDASANEAVGALGDSADFYLGTAVGDKAGATLVGRVDLNANAGTPPATPRGMFQSMVFELDHADATETVIIPAGDNPNGLVVVSFCGEVTEAPVGTSEDQLILELLDEDDNSLSTITTTDTTPDAIGDIVQGIKSVMAASTGDVLAIIPADKAAKVKVNQATAGGTPAGKVKVRVLVMSLL